ncbi:MAG: aminotransferase class V-fold PLP-dependent enzyme [Pirellulales bacterium]
MTRIYLDNAATSWPKPEAVYRAVDHAMREWGVASGRGASREADDIARMLDGARRDVAELINSDSPARVVFTNNGTAALNPAIHGVLRPGDHAICSAADHNSVLRPLRFLQAQGVASTIVPCDATGWVDPDAVRRALRPNTRLIALTHASNVTGCLQDVAAVGRIARA